MGVLGIILVKGIVWVGVQWGLRNGCRNALQKRIYEVDKVDDDGGHVLRVGGKIRYYDTSLGCSIGGKVTLWMKWMLGYVRMAVGNCGRRFATLSINLFTASMALQWGSWPRLPEHESYMCVCDVYSTISIRRSFMQMFGPSIVVTLTDAFRDCYRG